MYYCYFVLCIETKNLIHMTDDKYKLAEKSNTELRAWIAEHEQDTAEYTAGIEESMRRVAAMEEIMEKNEAPIWKREEIALGVAILSLVVIICVIVFTY
jgi:hypothetical protein